MLASETQNADYLQGDDARWNHKEIERLRGYTMCIHIYICMYICGKWETERDCVNPDFVMLGIWWGGVNA